MSEQWQPVPDWPDYEVSSVGRVKSLARSWIKSNGVRITLPEAILTCGLNHNGYVRVTLSDRSGQSRHVLVHVLMAQAFIGTRPEGEEVRHLNDVPDDNRLENLAYGTSTENKLDMVRNGGGNVAKTHCGTCGFELAGRNLILKDGGRRRDCRNCQCRANREYRARKKRLQHPAMV